MYNKRDDKINAFGWKNEWNIGQASLMADVSWSKATRDELNLKTTPSSCPPQLDTLRLAFTGGGFAAGARPGLFRPSKLFLRNTIYGSGYGKVPQVDDELKGFRLARPCPARNRSAACSPTLSSVSTTPTGRRTSASPKAASASVRRAIPPSATTCSMAGGRPGFAGVGLHPSWNVPAAVGAT